MKMISRIKDQEIGQRNIYFSNAKIRSAVSGIVKKEDKIALINVSNLGYYLLPGACMEEKNDFREAFITIVEKQLGCKIDVEKVIGYIEEERYLTRLKQTSYIYVANVVDIFQDPQYTEEELFHGTKIEWVDPYKALIMVATAYENLNIDDAEDLYRIKFDVKRSQTILEEYIKNN